MNSFSKAQATQKYLKNKNKTQKLYKLLLCYFFTSFGIEKILNITITCAFILFDTFHSRCCFDAYFSSLYGVFTWSLFSNQQGFQGGTVSLPCGVQERIHWNILLVWFPNMLKKPVYKLKAFLNVEFKNSLKIEFFCLTEAV